MMQSEAVERILLHHSNLKDLKVQGFSFTFLFNLSQE